MTCLLFDIDGTLLDSPGAGGEALLESFRQLFSVEEPVSVMVHGQTDLGIFTRLLEANQLPVRQEYVQRLMERYLELLPVHLSQRAGSVLPGVLELLQQLVGQDRLSIGLLTGNLPEAAHWKLERHGLSSYFPWGVFGDSHTDRRDLGRAALPTIERHTGRRYRADEVVIIGDTPNDIACARAFGGRVLAVATGHYTLEELAEHRPDGLLADLADTEQVLRWFREGSGGA
jgi:phosphoglycolate phosphatase